MHHTPSGPPPSARLTAALSRGAFLLRRSLHQHGRIAPAVLVCGVGTGIALILPVLAPAIPSADDVAVAPNSSAAASADPSRISRAERSDVVQWGVDGAGSPSAAAGTSPETLDAAPESAGEVPATDVPADTSTADTSTAESSTAESSRAEPSPSAPARTGKVTPSSSSSPSSSLSSSPLSSSSPSSSSPSSSSAPQTSASVPAAAPAPTADPSTEGQVLTLVNQERAAAGCGALVADDGLAAVARAFSADMRDRNFFSHTDPDGHSPFDRGDRAGVAVLGENIAYGQSDPASVMSDWMNSADHRANIVNCSYSRIGVGIAYGPGGPWWTQDFA